MIKILFVDFWPGFKLEDFFLYKVLKKNYQIELSEDPDFLVFSEYSNNHLNYDCVKIQYSAENIRPNYSVTDYAIGFDYQSSNNYLRLPLYVEYFDNIFTLEKLLRKKEAYEIDNIVEKKKKFCCFVVSNDSASKRIDFFKKLSAYKKVDSGGMTLNNVGGRVDNKLRFVENYKFTIAFENMSYPGYTTEKILQPFHVNTIPLYWGNPVIHEEFNTKSFLNWHEYENDESFIDEIIKIDNDESSYRKYLNESLFYDRKENVYFSEERLINYFDRIFKKTTTSVSSRMRDIQRVKRKIIFLKEKIEYRIKGLGKK